MEILSAVRPVSCNADTLILEGEIVKEKIYIGSSR
jgi:hypothetical protein